MPTWSSVDTIIDIRFLFIARFSISTFNNRENSVNLLNNATLKNGNSLFYCQVPDSTMNERNVVNIPNNGTRKNGLYFIGKKIVSILTPIMY